MPRSLPIAGRRLQNQRITHTSRGDAVDLVAWLGAVQAQEYPLARWGLGLRMRSPVRDRSIARAVDEGRILRTHVLRPTWHFLAPADIRWMLALTGPRVQRAMASICRRRELSPALCVRAAQLFERALGADRSLTRSELGRALADDGVEATGVRLALLTMYAELEAVICSGPYRGRQLTYALLDARVPAAPPRPRDEALAELTTRYFTSHGPATIRDFVWWSGVTTPDARRGLEMTRARREDIDGRTYWTLATSRTAPPPGGVHLLPIYDEYLVAYRDREAVPLLADGTRRHFPNPLVVDGHVVGTWRPVAAPHSIAVEVMLAKSLSAPARQGLEDAAQRYAAFLEAPVAVKIVNARRASR